MCGFSGWIGNDVAEYRLEKSLSALFRRGPDQQHTIQGDNFGFAHARLAIRDKNHGHQPYFEIGSNLILLFNGEIFNVKYLKELLKKHGKNCYTNCDTEIVYKLFLVFQCNAFTLLDGQFSIAIFDTTNNKLILARDIYGEKPLFYRLERGNIFFGSTIESISLLLGESPSFRVESMISSAIFWSELPYKTNYEGVHSLEPGSYIIFSDENLFKKSFGILNPQCESDETMTPADFNNLMVESVAERIVSDRSIGVYLSGGLDSSAVAWYAKDLAGSKALKSYGIGFKNNSYDESADQLIVADELNLNHKIIEHDDIYFNNEKIGINQSEACSHRLGYGPFYKLSSEAKADNVGVILTGEGADELLLGYDHYRESLILNKRNDLTESQLKKIILDMNNFISPQINLDQYCRYKFNELNSSRNLPLIDYLIKLRMPVIHSLAPLLKMNVISSVNQIIDSWKSYLNEKYNGFSDVLMSNDKSYQWRRVFDIETLLSGHLLRDQGDRPSMYNSVETRAPFLSKKLLNEVQSHYKFNTISNGKFTEKEILRNCISGKISNAITNKRKFPFRTPDNRVAEYLTRSIDNINDEYFDKVAINNYLKKVIIGEGVNPSISASVLSLIFSTNHLLSDASSSCQPYLKLVSVKKIESFKANIFFKEYEKC